MFKNHYIKKLAFDNIRKQKELYKFIFLSLILVFFMVILFSILFASFEEIGYIEKYQRYGKWSVAFENISEDDKKFMKENKYVEKNGSIYQLDHLSYHGYEVGSLYSIDEQSQDLLSLQVKKGRMPQSRDEISIEEDQLIALNIPLEVDQTLTFEMNGIKKQYELVGILQNYTTSYPMKINSFITFGEKSSQQTTLYTSNDNVSFWNSLLEQDKQVTLNTRTYQYSQDSTTQRFLDSHLLLYFQLVLLMIGFCGILGTVTSSIEKRENHLTLMKAIGASSKQLQKLVIYEGGFIECFSIIIGVVLAVLVSFMILGIYCYSMNSAFVWKIGNQYYFQLILAIVVSFLALWFPSWKAKSAPLVGKVTQRVRYKKYKKSRKNNPLSLAIRELKDHKIITITFVVVSVVCLIDGISGILMIESLQDHYQIMNEENIYDYVIDNGSYGDVETLLTSQELEELTSFSGISSQIFYKQMVYMNYDFIKDSRLIENDFFSSQLQDDYDGLLSAICVSYENEGDFYRILNKYGYKNIKKLGKDEIILFKPHIYFDDGRCFKVASKYDDNQQEYFDPGLEKDTMIEMIYDETKSSYSKSQPLKIIETVYIDDMDIQDNRYVFQSDYMIFMNREMYQKYFGSKINSTILFDVQNSRHLLELKEKVLTMTTKHSLQFDDSYTKNQMETAMMLENTLKGLAFVMIMIIGLFMLLYMQRKIYVLNRRNEITLYRAVGMTRQQIYLMNGIYGIFIVCISEIVFLMCYVVISLDNGLERILEDIHRFITNPISMIITFIVLFFIFCIILIPIREILKDNILKYIQQDIW